MALIVLSCASQAAAATAFVGGTNDWTFVSEPTITRLGISEAAASTFDNRLEVSVLAVVIMVVRNDAGQMVSFSTATLNITRGSYGTAYTPEFGLPFGTYNATIFAMTIGGVAISNSSSVLISV